MILRRLIMFSACPNVCGVSIVLFGETAVTRSGAPSVERRERSELNLPCGNTRSLPSLLYVRERRKRHPDLGRMPLMWYFFVLQRIGRGRSRGCSPLAKLRLLLSWFLRTLLLPKRPSTLLGILHRVFRHRKFLVRTRNLPQDHL